MPDAAGDPRLVDDATLARWRVSTAAEFIRAIAEGEVPGAPHSEHVGLTTLKAEPGLVQLAWQPQPRLTNPAGIVHGGYLSIVCDDAAGLAAASLGERFVPMLTTDLHVHFLRPARPGERYLATGRVVHGGRTRVLAEARVEDGDGALIANATGTFVPNRAYAEAAARVRADG